MKAAILDKYDKNGADVEIRMFQYLKLPVMMFWLKLSMLELILWIT